MSRHPDSRTGRRPRRLRRPPRPVALAVALAVALGIAALAAGCVDPTDGPTYLGELRVRALYPPGMEPSAAGVRIDSVRAVVRRPGADEPLVERVLADPGEAGELRWVLDLLAEEERVEVSLEHRSGEQPLYSGEAVVAVQEGPVGGGSELHDVPVAWVGPERRAVSVEVRPARVVIPSIGGRRTLLATTRDAEGDTIARPVAWGAAVSGVITVDGAGEVVAVGPGETFVLATLDGVSDSARVRVDTGLARTTTITADAASLLSINQLSTTVTVRVLDGVGESVGTSAGPVTLESTLGTLGEVTDHGDGTYSAVLETGFDVGTAVVRGTLDGVLLADFAAVVFFGLPGAGVSAADPPEP